MVRPQNPLGLGDRIRWTAVDEKRNYRFVFIEFIFGKTNLQMLQIIFLDILWEIVNLHTTCHGAQGKNCCTVSNCALAIKSSLSVKKEDSNL